MSNIALILSILLAAQVNTGNDRYGNAGGSGVSPPPVVATGGNPGADGLLPKLDAAPPTGTAGAPPAASAPAEKTTYDRQPSPPPAATSRAPVGTPFNNASPPPAASSSQPPFRDSAARSAAPPSAQSTPGIKPTAIMKQMMSAPPSSQLTGSPVTLTEAIAGATSRQDQAQRVDAYWDLCSSVADYYLGVREQDELRKLRSIAPRAGAALQQAEAEFGVRLSTSRQAAVASQRRLASMIGRDGSLPLPADLPHCGSYQSEYEAIFAGRPSTEASELAALLPLRYAELKAAGVAVLRAQESIGTVASNDSGEGADTLHALELLALRRRAFVQIARDYNRRIARYTELSTPGEIGPERLISMLIIDNSPTATRPFAPTGATGRQSRRAVSPPPTFDENWQPASDLQSAETTRQDDAVQQAAAESAVPKQERSLLVPSQN